MKLSASKAAKEVGVSIPTITRACKSGKLSSEPVEGGGYLIDTAELFRVFPAVTSNSNVSGDGLGRETPPETAVLEVENRMLRDQVARLDKAADDLRQDRDQWREQASRLLISSTSTARPGPVEPGPADGTIGPMGKLLRLLVRPRSGTAPAANPSF